MTRNLKTLGLALVAALAIGATAAAAASAETAYFLAEETPVALSGSPHSGEDVFTTTAGAVACSTVGYTGELTEQEATTVEVTPTYSGCTAFGFAGTTFQTNGCKYRLTAGTLGSEKPEGTIDIVCPEGKEMTVTAALFGTTKCTIHVPPQTGLGTATYTNVGETAHDVTVAMNLGEIEYTHTAGTGFGACTSGSAGNGSYTGAALIAGGTGEAPVGLAVAAAKPLFVLNPKKVDFENGGKGKIKPIVIENKSQEEPEIDMIITIGDYDHKDKCFEKTLKKEKVAGDKCTEEMECEKAGAIGTVRILATESYAVHKATLEKC